MTKRPGLAAGALAQCLATGETFTEARELGRGLRNARQRLLRSRGREQKAARVLPELNGRLPFRSGIG